MISCLCCLCGQARVHPPSTDLYEHCCNWPPPHYAALRTTMAAVTACAGRVVVRPVSLHSGAAQRKTAPAKQHDIPKLAACTWLTPAAAAQSAAAGLAAAGAMAALSAGCLSTPTAIPTLALAPAIHNSQNHFPPTSPAAVLLLSPAAALAEAAPPASSMAISFAPQGFKQAMEDRDEAMRNKCPGGMMDCEWLPSGPQHHCLPSSACMCGPRQFWRLPIIGSQSLPSPAQKQTCHFAHAMQAMETAGIMPSSSGRAFWSGAGLSASGASPRTRRRRWGRRRRRQRGQANELPVLNVLGRLLCPCSRTVMHVVYGGDPNAASRQHRRGAPRWHARLAPPPHGQIQNVRQTQTGSNFCLPQAAAVYNLPFGVANCETRCILVLVAGLGQTCQHTTAI